MLSEQDIFSSPLKGRHFSGEKAASLQVFYSKEKKWRRLRNTLKEGGDNLVKKFGDKFQKLQVEGVRKKSVEML